MCQPFWHWILPFSFLTVTHKKWEKQNKTKKKLKLFFAFFFFSLQNVD